MFLPHKLWLMLCLGAPSGARESEEPGEELVETAATGETQPKHSLWYFNLLAARSNPLGLENRLNLGYRFRLYDRPGKLFDNSHLAALTNLVVSPAVARIGGSLQAMPIAAVRLRATYGFVQYYSTFQYLQSYDSPTADYSPQQLSEARDAGTNYPGSGAQLELEALLQAKVWRIAIRNDLHGFFNHGFRLRQGDDLWYDVRIDALVPAQGWVLTNDSDLLYVHDLPKTRRVTAGVRNTVVHSLYPRHTYADGEDPKDDPNPTQDRIGPLLAFTFYQQPKRRFDSPTLFLIAQWHLTHRWRTGFERVRDPATMERTRRGVSQAVPTVVLGLAFAGHIVGR